MKYLALKELPDGIQPGVVFNAPTDIGDIFVQVGAARALADEEITPERSTRRTYRRRDLQAEESDSQ